MVTIELNDLVFHAYHGVYPEEQKIGSNYRVQLHVSYEEGKRSFTDLKSTINYVDLYEIVKKKMQAPAPLLEGVAETIIRKIKHEFPEIRHISLSIYKLDAPIENFQGHVGVTIQKKFDD